MAATASTTAYTSASLANETVFASVNPTTGIPSAGGLMYAGISGLARIPEVTVGDLPSTPNDDRARCRPEGTPPTPNVATLGGVRIDVSKGDVVLTFEDVPLLGAGSGAIGSYLSLPLWQMLATALGTDLSSPAAHTVDAAASDYSYTVAAWVPIAPVVGTLISVEIAGRMEYSAITKIDALTLHHSPAFSRGLVNGDVVRTMATFFPIVGDSGEASLSIRLDGTGVRAYCHGCRHRSSVWTVVGTRAQVVVTMASAAIMYDHASASVECPVIPCGAAEHLAGSYVVIGAAPVPPSCAGVSPPYEIPREAVRSNDDSWPWTIETPLAPEGLTSDAVGIGAWVVTGWTGSIARCCSASVRAAQVKVLRSACLLATSRPTAGSGT